MIKKLDTYKCEVCGNIVYVLHAGGGQLVCCGKPMKLLESGTTDGAKEKHVPVVEKQGNGYLVKIGSIPHPMLAEHYIEWIELVTENKVYRKFLKPGDLPEAFFDCVKEDKFTVKEYCNLHGLWETKK